MRYFFCLVLLPIVFGLTPVRAAELTQQQLIEIGRQIYQEGRLPGGQPVKATVLGNVEVTGAQFTCMNCHRRSGLGGPEGTKYVLAANGASLLIPRTGIYMPRPAYTELSFAAALRTGQSPGGDYFDPIMPRYNLNDEQMRALFAYLKTVSNEFSPGLSDDELHVATIVGEDVPPADREAMLSVVEKFFANKNAETRYEQKRQEKGPFYQEYRNKAYRRWHLHIWELKGPRESWAQQLQAYYQQQPVFLLLSGRVEGSWQPVHQFCKQNRIPCLLPNTDLPVVEAENDFYTFYFSQGLFLEARIMADQLTKQNAPKKVLQVYRADSSGAAAAIALTDLLPGVETADFILPGNADDWSGLAKSLRQLQPDGLVLWLDLPDLQGFAGHIDSRVPVYLSSSLIDDRVKEIPAAIKPRGRLIQLFNLPEDQQQQFLRVASWMKMNKLPLTDERLQGQTYYACLLLNAGLKHMKRFFYRDFFLDLLDHGERMAAYSGIYPRLSFGPEQRFLAKGGYLLDLRSGNADWLVPYR